MKLDVQIEADSFRVLTSLVEEGLGYTLLPPSSVRARGRRRPARDRRDRQAGADARTDHCLSDRSSRLDRDHARHRRCSAKRSAPAATRVSGTSSLPEHDARSRRPQKPRFSPEPVLQKHAVARRQRAVDMAGGDRGCAPAAARRRDPAVCAEKPRCPSRSVISVTDANAGAGCDHIELRAEAGMADLHSRFAEMAVVEHDDRRDCRAAWRRWSARLPMPISCSPSPVMTATGPLRLRQRQAEPDHRRAAHRAPQIEIAGMLAGIEHVVGRRAEAGDHEQVPAVGQQRLHGFAAVERECRLITSSPSISCGRSCAAKSAPRPAGRSRTPATRRPRRSLRRLPGAPAGTR